MRKDNEKKALKDYEFTDYDFYSKSARKTRKIVRRNIKRAAKNQVKQEIEKSLED